MRIMSGEQPPDAGSVWTEPGLRMARLEQDVPFSTDRTVFDVVADGLGDLSDLVTGYHRTAVKLAEENKKEVKAFKIRLGYVNASAESHVFSRLYDYAESERLPVLFHTGDTAFSTGDLVRAHPLTLDGLQRGIAALRR